MVLRRLFGGSSSSEAAAPPASAQPSRATAGSATADTDTIRRIAAQLEALPMEQRRFIGGFAYVLGRAAHADLDISPDEVAFMERTVVEVGGLTEAQAVLVVQIARSQAELQGATEDYLVTRQFAAAASREDRERLLRLAFAVGAADDSISVRGVRGAQRDRQGAGLHAVRDRHHAHGVRGQAVGHPGDAPAPGRLTPQVAARGRPR